MASVKNISKENILSSKLTGKLELTLLLLILLLPFVGVSYLLNSKLDAETRFIAQQKAGFDYVNAVHTLLGHVQQYRGVAYIYLSGAHEFKSRLPELIVLINEDMRAVEKMRAAFDSKPQAKREWVVWRKDWLKLQQLHLQMSPADNFDAYTLLIDELLSSVREVVDVFRLVHDSQLDSSTMAEAVMQIPWLMEDIGQVRGLGAGVIVHGSTSANEKVRLRVLDQSISIGMDNLVRNMSVFFQRNPSQQARLSDVLDQAVSSTNHFLGIVHKQIIGSAALKVSAKVYFSTGTTALNDYYRLFAAIDTELGDLLTTRLEDMQQKRTWMRMSMLLVLVVTIAIYVMFLRHQAVRQRLWQKLQNTVAELTESKQKIQAIVENAADGIVTVNESGVIDSFSKAAELMFDYSAAEVIGQNVKKLMPEPYHGHHDDYLKHYMETRKGQIIGTGPRELMAQRRDGTTFPVELAVSEMYLKDHHRMFVGLLRDITRRKEAEQELRASEERFTLITRGTKDGIWDWDLTTGQIYFSPRWKAMLGYDEIDIMDSFLSLQKLIHPDDLGLALDSWTSCMEGKNSAFVIEYRLCNKQGDYRWIECRGLSQLDIEGNPVRIAGSHTDITERKQAYTELQKMTKELATKAAELDLSNKELEQFAYIASHDLKAPLRAIANLSQWIEEDLDEAMTNDTRKQMTLLRSRVLRMEGLINGVLQYSRVGRIDTEIETVDVTQLLDEVLDGLDPPAGFHIDIDPDMPVLQTARVPLSQIFSNLLSNAIKYHDRPESAQITVSVRSLNDVSYEFTVADDGPGIAPEYHNKVFQIFQTLNARDTVESTGVGLTVVKKIVEQLGGEITLESAEGEGSSFRFSVPKTKYEGQTANNEVDSENPASVVERNQGVMNHDG